MMSNDKSATKRMFELLDERGVEYEWNSESFSYDGFNGVWWIVEGRHDDNVDLYAPCATPEQAIEVTLGHKQQSDPVWEQWLNGLKHDEIKTIGDAVQQLMYESIEHGGDMGPNGNTYGGVDEGEVLTLGFINDWIEKFDALLEHKTCKVEKNTDDYGWYCECGNFFPPSVPPHNFCPNCGRKVVN